MKNNLKLSSPDLFREKENETLLSFLTQQANVEMLADGPEVFYFMSTSPDGVLYSVRVSRQFLSPNVIETLTLRAARIPEQEKNGNDNLPLKASEKKYLSAAEIQSAWNRWDENCGAD